MSAHFMSPNEIGELEPLFSHTHQFLGSNITSNLRKALLKHDIFKT